MNANQAPRSQRDVFRLILAMLTVSLGVYILMTYLAEPSLPVRQPMPSLQLFTTILTLVAFAGVIIGLAVEAAMQRAATSPGGVRAAGIVSAALGEAPALYGLVIFFVSGHRNWFFFGLSIVYFIGMWLRLPGMLRRMDELFPKS